MNNKITKSLLVSFSLLIFLSTPSLALSPQIQQKKDQIIEKYSPKNTPPPQEDQQTQSDTATQPAQIRQQVEKQIQQKIEENQALRDQNRLQVMQKVSSNIKQRLQQRFTYLSQFQLKIQDHLNTLAGNAIDTSQASQELAKVGDIIASYQLHLSQLSGLEASLVESQDPTQLSNSLRQASQLVNKDLIQYRQTLRQTLTLLIKSQNQ